MEKTDDALRKFGAGLEKVVGWKRALASCLPRYAKPNHLLMRASFLVSTTIEINITVSTVPLNVDAWHCYSGYTNERKVTSDLTVRLYTSQLLHLTSTKRPLSAV